MNVLPTIKGGLAIELNSESDWEVLEMITRDIGNPSDLATSLTKLIDDDGDWEDYVLPDLKDHFDNQCHHVTTTIRHARENGESTIFIQPDQSEQWYGTINQARLALEARYQLDSIDDFENVTEELSHAHYRDRFYLIMLSMLMDYIIDPE